MRILNVSSESSYQRAVLELSYAEVRDLTNALYYVTEGLVCETPKKYDRIRADCALAFDLVKHGIIQPSTVGLYEKVEVKGE